MEDQHQNDSIMRLNKFCALCGIGSRRASVEIIKKGEIKVDGIVETNPFRELNGNEVVTHKDQPIEVKEELSYILFNKPKNTLIDEVNDLGRPSAIDLVKKRTEINVLPVGTLDPNTTGLMIFTNDKAVIEKLTNPDHEMKIVYQLTLSREIDDKELELIKTTIQNDEQFKFIKGIDLVAGQKNDTVGVQIFNDHNQLLNLLFEKLGIEILKSDRVFYAGLTKKDLTRGWSRPLTEKEIILVKHFV